MSKKELFGCLLIVILTTSAFTCVGTGVALLAIKFLTFNSLKILFYSSLGVAIVSILVTSIIYNNPEYHEPDSGSNV